MDERTPREKADSAKNALINQLLRHHLGGVINTDLEGNPNSQVPEIVLTLPWYQANKLSALLRRTEPIFNDD